MAYESFFATLAPQAIRARQEGSPLFPSVRLAQNLLETGGVIPSWNNLGGLKAGGGAPNAWWRGRVVTRGTWESVNGARVETTAAFRAYDSVYDFYRDQDRLLETARYTPVRGAGTPQAQAAALQASGYATDPAYADKLRAIIRTYGLERYDVAAAREEANELELSNYQRDMLVEVLQRLLDRKVITDPSWVERARNGSLTLSELTWLNTIMIANK